jgi:hypothetical protein
MYGRTFPHRDPWGAAEEGNIACWRKKPTDAWVAAAISLCATGTGGPSGSQVACIERLGRSLCAGGQIGSLSRFVTLYAAMYAAYGVASPFLPVFVLAVGTAIRLACA